MKTPKHRGPTYSLITDGLTHFEWNDREENEKLQKWLAEQRLLNNGPVLITIGRPKQ